MASLEHRPSWRSWCQPGRGGIRRQWSAAPLAGENWPREMARLGPHFRRALSSGDLRIQPRGRRFRDTCDAADGNPKAAVQKESAMKKTKPYWEMTTAELRDAT